MRLPDDDLRILRKRLEDDLVPHWRISEYVSPIDVIDEALARGEALATAERGATEIQERLRQAEARLKGYHETLIKLGPVKPYHVDNADSPIELPEPETLAGLLDRIAALEKENG